MYEIIEANQDRNEFPVSLDQHAVFVVAFCCDLDRLDRERFHFVTRLPLRMHSQCTHGANQEKVLWHQLVAIGKTSRTR